MHRFHCLEPHAYGAHFANTFHVMLKGASLSFKFHTCCERLVASRFRSFVKDCLWFAYLILNSVPLIPIYSLQILVFSSITVALYTILDSLHSPDWFMGHWFLQLHGNGSVGFSDFLIKDELWFDMIELMLGEQL